MVVLDGGWTPSGGRKRPDKSHEKGGRQIGMLRREPVSRLAGLAIDGAGPQAVTAFHDADRPLRLGQVDEQKDGFEQGTRGQQLGEAAAGPAGRSAPDGQRQGRGRRPQMVLAQHTNAFQAAGQALKIRVEFVGHSGFRTAPCGQCAVPRKAR